MAKLISLKPGDQIAIFAVGSGVKNPQEELKKAAEFLESWELKTKYPADLFGEFTNIEAPANTPEKCFANFMAAATDPDIKIIWSFRGGRYTDQIMNLLANAMPPKQTKLVIGLSDNSPLLNFLVTKWHWPVIHGSGLRQLALNSIDLETKRVLKDLLFGKVDEIKLDLEPLNEAARREITLDNVTLGGGNLISLQTTIGTPWQLEAKNILILEDIDEPISKINRALNHFVNAGILKNTKAIILGDFAIKNEKGFTNINIKENDKTGNFQQFFAYAKTNNIPVLRATGIGHTQKNIPLSFGTRAELRLGKKPLLINTTELSTELTTKNYDKSTQTSVSIDNLPGHHL